MPTLTRYLATFAATILVTGPASAALFDNVYLFGDSLLDGGNAFVATGGFPPYPGSSPAPGIPAPYSGRLTNGPTAGEILALNPAIRGTPVLPSYYPGGTNYAVGGATTRTYVDVLGSEAPPPFSLLPRPTMTTSNQIAKGYWYFDDTYSGLGFDIDALRTRGISQQVAGFSPPAGFDANRSLFTLWGGANDFFVDAQTAPEGAANMVSFIDALYDKGARNFLVINLPDLSLTPYGQSLSAPEQFGLSQLTAGFNAALTGGIQTLRAANDDIRIVDFQVDDFLSGLLGDPAAMTALGFDPTKAFQPCFSLATLSVCSNPDEHIFWDDVHPTARAHQVLGGLFAGAVVAAVPEPSTWATLATGLALLVVAAGLRRRR